MNIFFVDDVAEKREWIDNKNSVAESVAVGHGAVHFFNSTPFFVTLCVIQHSVLPAKVRVSIFPWLNVNYGIDQELVSVIQ